jgi:uncharacterized protein YecE (DUF72 family)
MRVRAPATVVSTTMTIYLGTQGWGYKDWLGSLYPAGTRSQDYLAIYAQHFGAVELDTTFYGTPRPASVDAWNRSTPDDFQFTAKIPRIITHDRRLVQAEPDFVEFLSAMQALGPKLGPLLLQFPPDFTSQERPALERFFQVLPDDFRFAAEFRHRSWLEEETYDLLRRHNVAWTVIDLNYMPKHVEITTDFVYVRWLGDHKKITRMDATQIDRRGELDTWAEVLDEVARHVQRIYGFANNHYSGHSPADIRHLISRLGVPDRPAPTSLHQGSLL